MTNLIGNIFRGLLYLLVLVCSPLGFALSAADGYKFYEDAARRYSDGDYKAAIIQLKNALKESPGHLPSRVLLGKAYLVTGDAPAAEKEFIRALRLGANEELVFEQLGNALLIQSKHEALLVMLRSRNPTRSGGPIVLMLRGQAYLELGRLADAELSFRQAAMMIPDIADPLLGQASILMAKRQFPEAEKLVDQAIKLEPEKAEVWYRKGMVRRAARDPHGALPHFDRSILLQPNHIRAHLARAQIRFELGETQSALADAEWVRKKNPKDPHAAFLLARILSRQGDDKGAAEAFEDVTTRISRIKPEILMRDTASLHLASLVSFAKRDYETANRYLMRYLEFKPNSLATRKMLGRTKLKIGDLKGAIAVLQPLEKMSGVDAEGLMLLGDAYLNDGWYHQAMSVFERAAKMGANDPGMAVQLALSRIGAGQRRQAIKDLETSFRLDTGTMRAGIVLAYIQANSDDKDAALETASQLVEMYPNSAIAYNLLGAIHRSLGEFDQARTSFETALKLNSAFDPAIFNLAGLDIQAGDLKGASRRYRAVLEVNPRTTRAWIGLADIALAKGDTFEAIIAIQKAVSIDPKAFGPQIQLIKLNIELVQYNAALAAAKKLYSYHPEHSKALEWLARAQIAAGHRQSAIQTLQSAVRYAGYKMEQLIQIAKLQVEITDYEGARWTLLKVLNTGKSDEANTALVRLELFVGKHDVAMSHVEQVKKESPESPLGLVLAGEVFIAMDKYQEALTAYQQAMQKEPSSQAAMGIFNAQSAIGETDEALVFLEDWTRENVQDLRARKTLALAYLKFDYLDDALNLHEELIKLEPENSLLLSNLARLYQLRKDPRARDHAQRAVDLAPDWPIALDTLGWILVMEGEAERGLKLLREAFSRASTNLLIRYHLAAALSELGRTKEARVELETILRSGQSLPWIDEVRNLRE